MSEAEPSAGPSEGPGARTYRRDTIILFAVYGVLCFAAPWAIERAATPRALDIALAVLPAVPIFLWMLVFARFVASRDELDRTIQLLSFAITLGVILMFATAYGFMEVFAGAPDFPMFLLLPGAALVWSAARFGVTRRYR